MVQEVNWRVFKAKFNGQEQSQFEWFCYLLFCKKFDRPEGIPRYVNQTGIETEPIDVGGQKIGWQAKFYETRLSEHKQDFIESINKTKDKHPQINKIIFYINKDFGEGSSNPHPKYKKDIESHAQRKKVEIEWKTNSFFKSPFVCEENKNIAQYFFSLDNSIFDFVHELSSHTENLLSSIRSEIVCQTNKIKINRSEILQKLKESLIKSPVVILTGEAGSGKTAIIKDWYNELKKQKLVNCFIFKATEFNIPHINHLFKNYGDWALSDFIDEYRQEREKYIVIDSAEKLSDLQNHEVFKEFLSSLLSNNWKVIFTTRYNYLDDLQYQLSSTYDINSLPLIVPKLTIQGLTKFSKEYSFNLPKNRKLVDILKTPFFLNEYLRIYPEIQKNTDHSSFKEMIWKNKILNSSFQLNNIHIEREKYFLKLVKNRVTRNLFFENVDGFNSEVSRALEGDEVIKYNSRTGGYFITHDIYEEWALNKIIERSFVNRENYKKFFNNIGSSLPIRRAFRDWISEKLYLKDEEITRLIEESIQSDDIEKHWEDEILTSVLLSNYCSHFFDIFKSKLIKEGQQKNEHYKLTNILQSHYKNTGLLYKLLFLLRIACKEADENVFTTYGLPKTDQNKKLFETIFIQPKGEGWSVLIKFLNKHKEIFELHYINLILPVLEDWNNKNRKGETTKKASQLALFYYEKIINEKDNFSYGAIKKRLIKVIFNGSFEIKTDLKNIFQLVISKKETNHNSRYYQFACTILTSPVESIEVIKNLPEQVIQLANLFWTYQPEEKKLTLNSVPLPEPNPNLEECFSIKNQYRFKYSPANALNTPILCLLISSYKQAVDFILFFVNKSVKSFAKSRFARELKEVELFIDDNTSVKQHCSDRLWNMYRGTQVTPKLLTSIHMALERYFLYNCKDISSNILEERLLYLLTNSKSSSISAVVASIVLAYPEKTFNVAKILFQTKEFFLFDNARLVLDQIPIDIVLNSFTKESLSKNERIESNKLEHRQKSLEHLALQYQFALHGIVEKTFEDRRKMLWKILDNYYQKLPDHSSETEKDKVWRLYLARMDGRKMKPIVRKISGKNYITFNPQVSSALKKHRENKLKKINEDYKYASLKMWATYRLENREGCKEKKYLKYENNPSLVVKETKEVIETFRLDRVFDAFDRSIPVYTCSVLIRDYFTELKKEDQILCRQIIMNYASSPLQDDYLYQVTDGVSIAIQMLSHLLQLFPKDKKEIEKLLFSILISIQQEDIHQFIIVAMQNMWNKNFKDAHSIFLGYLWLHQDFDSLSKKMQSMGYEDTYQNPSTQKLENFLDKNQKKIDLMINNKLTYSFLIKNQNLDKMNLETMITAFQMLPFKVKHKEHKEFIKLITPIFLKILL